MPEQKDQRDRADVLKPEPPEPGDQKPEQDDAVKGATRLPRKGDELDDLHGTPTD